MIAAHALLLLNVPIYRVVHRMREQWEGRYHLLGEFFQGDSMFAQAQEYSASRLRPVTLAAESPVVGSALGELDLNGVAITALVRQGERQTAPPGDFRLEAGDVVVLFGPTADLDRAERVLLG